jgi:hypothetical protein
MSEYLGNIEVNFKYISHQKEQILEEATIVYAEDPIVCSMHVSLYKRKKCFIFFMFINSPKYISLCTQRIRFFSLSFQ